MNFLPFSFVFFIACSTSMESKIKSSVIKIEELNLLCQGQTVEKLAISIISFISVQPKVYYNNKQAEFNRKYAAQVDDAQRPAFTSLKKTEIDSLMVMAKKEGNNSESSQIV